MDIFHILYVDIEDEFTMYAEKNINPLQDFENVVQGHRFTCNRMQKNFNLLKITSNYILKRSLLAYFKKHLKQKYVFKYAMK